MANAPSKADNEPLGVQDARASYQASAVSSPRVPPGHKLTEVGMIPEEWVAQALGPHVQINSGESPSLFRFETSGVPYFKVDQLNNDSKYLSATPYFFRKGKTVPRGSLIFPKRGASILLNKVRILASDSFMDTNLMTLTPEPSLDNEYLYYTLTHIGLWKFSDTTSIPQINNKHVNPLVVPVPHLSEQRAIAAVLSDVDALLAKLDQLITKKRDLKQAAMQQLLTGQTRLPGFSKEWDMKRVAELGDVVTGGTPRTDINDFWGDGYPWVTPTDISSHRDMYTSERSLTQKGLNEIRALPANTVLVTCIASIGKNAILKIEGGCNQQINAVIPNKNNSAEFLYYLFEASKQYLLANAGTTATSIISKAAFGELAFKVPSLSEQSAIAAVLFDIDAEIAALEARRDKTRRLKQGMMQELLTGRIRLV